MPVRQVRRKYLNQLSEYTKRNVIAYYSDFLSGASVNPEQDSSYLVNNNRQERSTLVYNPLLLLL